MTTSELNRSLNEAAICKNLSSEELNMLIEHSQLIEFSKEDIILAQGKKSPGIFIIIEGKVCIAAKILGQGHSDLAMLHSGNFLGEVSVLEDGPCATSAVASSFVKCLLISSAYLEMLKLFFPETHYKLLKNIAEEVYVRIQNIYQKIVLEMKKTEMETQSLFGTVITSLFKEATTDFHEEKLDIKQLEKNNFFSIFSPEELKDLFSHSSLIKTAKHCNLIHKNEMVAPCYILLRGAVQSSMIEEKKIAKLSVLGPFTLFCDIFWLENCSPALITYTTCERAILLRITQADLTWIRKNNKTLWYKLFDLICKSFAALERSADKLDIRLNSELYNR